MADTTLNDSSDRGSPQYVAYLLLHAIARGEEKTDHSGRITTDKKWVLETYEKCLSVVKGGRA